jgi:hypothetical protein
MVATGGTQAAFEKGFSEDVSDRRLVARPARSAQESGLSELSDPIFIERLVSIAKPMLKESRCLVGYEPLDFVHDAIVVITRNAANETLNWDPSVGPLDHYMAGIMKKLIQKRCGKPEYRDRANVDPEDLDSIPTLDPGPEHIFGDKELIEACRRCPSLPGCKLKEIIDAAMREEVELKKGWIANVARRVGLTADRMDRRIKKLRNIIRFLQKPHLGGPKIHGICQFGSDCMAAPHARGQAASGDRP